MTNLAPFIPAINLHLEMMAAGHLTNEDPRHAFGNELIKAGFRMPKQVLVGKLERIDAPDDKKGQRTGWYIYNEMPDSIDPSRTIGIGVYGSWRGNPDKVTWISKSTGAMADDERARYNLQLEQMRLAREAEQRTIHTEAAEKAAAIYNASTPATDVHPYLTRKQVPALGGARVSRTDLVIPVLTDTGHIASLQFIKPDGEKKFLTGGRKKGCWFTIPATTNTGAIYIAEGYSTAASVHLATGAACMVAFDAGNLYEVAVAVKSLHPDALITLAADDDVHSETNAGRTKATQVASSLGLSVIFPVFSPASLTARATDWNDLHVLEGLDTVKAQLNNRPATYEATPATTSLESVAPAGILADIMHYYNATSGNSQPLFAIQSAIAVCSVLCGRAFETNFGNRSSVYMMNLAKSGTGKEHAKRVVERILNACGHGKLIGGDGYTAGGSVFSALMERPRHIAIIDEFSKYLQAAQNKYGGSHMMEANSQLMQAFGRLDGIMRPKSYSTIGLAKDKRKEMADLHVVNPAITLLAMSTPEDLFDKLEVSSIKDGFLNRFLICISDVPRAVRQHREQLDVPQRIKDWAAAIDTRRGAMPDMAADTPQVIQLVFSTEAVDMQEAFQLECIKLADNLERFSLAEMPMRFNEIAMRLALIHALAVDPQADTITAEDMGWAIGWVRMNGLELIRRLKMSVSGSDFEAMKKAVLGGIRASGAKGITMSRMHVDKPFSTLRKRDLIEVLEALEQADLIFREPATTGKRGRPTITFFAHAD